MRRIGDRPDTRTPRRQDDRAVCAPEALSTAECAPRATVYTRVSRSRAPQSGAGPPETPSHATGRLPIGAVTRHTGRMTDDAIGRGHSGASGGASGGATRDAAVRLEHVECEKSVIESIYAATTDPAMLDAFEAYWEAYIDMLLQRHGDGRIDLSDAPVNAHIARAISITDRLAEFGERSSRAQALVDATPGPAVLIDAQARVINANADAAAWLARLSPGTAPAGDAAAPAGWSRLQLNLSAGARTRLADFLATLEQHADGATPFIFLEASVGDAVDDEAAESPGGDPTECLLLTALKLRGGADAPPARLALLSSVELDHAGASPDALRTAFGLTATEAEIALALARGDNAREIAAKRGVRKATLDKQIKSVRRKTGTRSIADLARVVSLMLAQSRTVAAQIARVGPDAASDAATTRRHVVTLRDGRRMAVVEQGHPKGRPVLIHHTSLGMGQLDACGARAAVLRNIRLIIPWRPGYEESDGYAYRSVDHMLDVCADDARDVLAACGVDKAIVVEGRLGQRTALRHPDRVRALLCLQSVPQWRDHYLDHHTGRRRNMLKTSIHAPGAVRYLARVGQMILRSGRPDLFVTGLSKSNPVDAAALGDPALKAMVTRGMQSMANSVDAYAWDVRLRHTDCGGDTPCLRVPVGVLVGERTDWHRPAKLDSFRELLPPDLPYAERIVPGEGTYLHLTRPEELLDMIDRLDTLAGD